MLTENSFDIHFLHALLCPTSIQSQSVDVRPVPLVTPRIVFGGQEVFVLLSPQETDYFDFPKVLGEEWPFALVELSRDKPAIHEDSGASV